MPLHKTAAAAIGHIFILWCLATSAQTTGSDGPLSAEFVGQDPPNPVPIGTPVTYTVTAENTDAQNGAIGYGVGIYIDGVQQAASAGGFSSTGCIVDAAFPTFWACGQLSSSFSQETITFTWLSPDDGQHEIRIEVFGQRPIDNDFPDFFVNLFTDTRIGNSPPVLNAEIGPQTAIESSLFELNVFGNFSDADGDPLTFSATGLPASGNITIDPVTGIISGTPTLEDARDADPYFVTVTATDPSAASVSDSFELTVSALDRANIGLSIGVTPQSGLPNDQLTWTFTVANPIGPAAGENVELTGRFFGDGLSVAAAGGSGCSITVQTDRTNFVCTIGALPVGATASVNFTTIASQATEVVAFGTAAGAQAVPIDPNIANNSAVRAVGVAESFSDGAVQVLGSVSVRSIAAGDFDGDGTIDLVVGTAAGQPVQVYLGDEPRESCGCQRDFVSTPISIPDTGANEGVAVADFDNDGNLDLVIANGGGQPDAVYRNTGAANFVLSTLLAPSNGRNVAVGDFNNDGNPDIAIAATSPNPVYFGDGAGGFGAGILLGDAESLDVAVGRFDNDLFDDLVFANVGSDSQIWLNNGGTEFTTGATLPIGDAMSVAAKDLNRDNLDDLVFGRVVGGSDDVPGNPVLINQGGGTFDGTPELLGISPTLAVLIGDVSDDGLPDLVFINESGVHQIWTASGGSFVLHTEQIIDIGARAGVLADLGFADTNDPGGVDLALGGALGAGTAVYLNDSAGNLGLGDAVAPVITLNGETAVNVPSGSTYTDAGAAAADNIDGDISASIVITNPVNTSIPGTYTVTYTVRDSAGNEAQAQRTVIVQAPPPPPPPPPPVDQPPTITLNGAATVTLTEGDAYIDEGATASDPEDGDLTDRIAVDNPVDTRTPGTYTVTYTVEDSGGNQAQAERTVVVQEAPPPPPPPQTNSGGGGVTSLFEVLAYMLMMLALGGRRRRSAIGR